MKTIKKICFIILLSFIFTIPTIAQEKTNNQALSANEPNKFVIKGIVINAGTHEPLPYSHISIKNKPLGTITNKDGLFIFKYPEENKNDTIIISYIGYENYIKGLATFNDSIIIIELKPATIVLDEVEVQAKTALSIIEEAIRKIPENYNTTPYIMTGFYRELIREKQDLHKYAEGVIDTYHEIGNKDLIKLIKGRKKENLKAFGVHKKADPTLGGPIGCFYKDITNYDMEFFNDEYFKYYDFTIEGMTSVNGKPAYIISFDKNPEAKKGKYKGIIYIDKTSKAVISINYEYNEYGLRKSQPDAVQRKLAKLIAGITFESLGSFTAVNYFEINGKWYLKSVKYKIIDKLTRKKKVYTYATEKDLMISEIKKENIKKFNDEELLNPKKEFSKQIGIYDEGFWKNYNTIKATETQKMLIDDMDNGESKKHR